MMAHWSLLRRYACIAALFASVSGLSAEFYVDPVNDTVVLLPGDHIEGLYADAASDMIVVVGIQQFIKENFREMYARWQEYSDMSFYVGK